MKIEAVAVAKLECFNIEVFFGDHFKNLVGIGHGFLLMDGCGAKPAPR